MIWLILNFDPFDLFEIFESNICYFAFFDDLLTKTRVFVRLERPLLIDF